jgi:hypothetical protein
LAVKVQVPSATLVTVDPETVQILVVVDANTTGLPEPPPVAVKAMVPPLNKTGVAGAKPVMVCAVNALAGNGLNDAKHRATDDRRAATDRRASESVITIFLPRACCADEVYEFVGGCYMLYVERREVLWISLTAPSETPHCVASWLGTVGKCTGKFTFLPNTFIDFYKT